MPFCTIADIEAFLRLDIPAGDPGATAAIAEATAVIQNYTRQQIELVEDDVYTFDVPERQTQLFLPEMPVVEVSDVTENDETLTEIADYRLGRLGILHRDSWQYWYPGVQTVTVTYTHGYAEIPPEIVGICVRAAARAYQAGLRAAETAGVVGVQGRTIGDYQEQLGAESASGSDGGSLGASAAPVLLPSERRVLDRYKHRGMGWGLR